MRLWVSFLRFLLVGTPEQWFQPFPPPFFPVPQPKWIATPYRLETFRTFSNFMTYSVKYLFHAIERFFFRDHFLFYRQLLTQKFGPYESRSRKPSFSIIA